MYRLPEIQDCFGQQIVKSGHKFYEKSLDVDGALPALSYDVIMTTSWS